MYTGPSYHNLLAQRQEIDKINTRIVEEDRDRYDLRKMVS